MILIKKRKLQWVLFNFFFTILVQVQNILEVVNPNGKFIVLLAVNDLIAGHDGSQWEILL